MSKRFGKQAQRIVFYPNEQIDDWYRGLPLNVRSQKINDLLLSALALNESTQDNQLDLQSPSPVADLDQRIGSLEDTIQDLCDWKSNLPGIAIFEEFETDAIRDGLDAVARMKDDLEDLASRLESLREQEKEVEYLRSRVEALSHPAGQT